MALIDPDTSEMVDFKPLEPGTYRARIISAVPKKSQKGNPMVEVTLKVQNGDKEITRKAWPLLKGPGAFMFDQLLRASGHEAVADQIKVPGSGVQFDTDELQGVELQVRVENELDDKDSVRDAIKGFLKA